MLKLREVEVFRPYPDEIPQQLLWDEGCDEAAIAGWLSAEFVRVGKFGGEVVGMYAMERGDGEAYLLRGVVVAPAYRRQGLGRWLVGHAIGVAESKGGRRVRFPGQAAVRFFSLIGFVADSSGQCFDLIPE